MKRKISLKNRIAIVLMLAALPLMFCLGTLNVGPIPLAAEKIQGLERYQGICRQFRVVDYYLGKGGSYEIAYFDFDNELTVRCIEGNWKDCGLTEEQLSAAEGTVCEVTYTKAESFGGAHRLFGIKSDGTVLVSEETMRKVFQKGARIVGIVFSITFAVGVTVFLLTGQRKQTKESQHEQRARRRQRKKAAYDRRKELEACRKERQSEKSEP